MVHLAEVRYVTTHLPVLQGLRLTPLGMLCGGWALRASLTLTLGPTFPWRPPTGVSANCRCSHDQRPVAPLPADRWPGERCTAEWWVPTGPAGWLLAYWLLRLRWTDTGRAVGAAGSTSVGPSSRTLTLGETKTLPAGATSSRGGVRAGCPGCDH